MNISPRLMKWLLNLYGPYIGAGVKTRYIACDWRKMRVEMPLRWYNRNIVGTHFGGSLYAMVDPHLMLMLMKLLGKDYVVWDQAASIRYLKPAKGRVSADFEISDAVLEAIRSQTASGQAYRHTFELAILDPAGETVCQVEKLLYIRRR